MKPTADVVVPLDGQIARSVEQCGAKVSFGRVFYFCNEYFTEGAVCVLCVSVTAM